MKIAFSFLFFLLTRLCIAKEYYPANSKLPYVVVLTDTVIPSVDSLKVLIVECKNQSYENFEKSIRNNPQLMEIQLYDPPVKTIDLLSSIDSRSLEWIYIKEFNSENLTLTGFQHLQVLSVESTSLKEFHMEKMLTDSLKILGIRSDVLEKWTCKPSMPSLGYLDLNTRLITRIPIENMPRLHQFVLYSSLKEFPVEWCNYPLKLFSIHSSEKIKVDKCLRQKLEDAYYSNITVGNSHSKTREYLSPDRKKKEKG